MPLMVCIYMPVQMETPQHFPHLVRSTQKASPGTSSVLRHNHTCQVDIRYSKVF